MDSDATQTLNRLAIPLLIRLAKSNNIKGVSNKKKQDVVKLIASRFPLIKDQIPALMEEQLKNMQIATEKRIVKGNLTRKMKEWGFDHRCKERVDIIFSIHYNSYMGENGEIADYHCYIKAKGDVNEVREGSIVVKITSTQSTAGLDRPQYSPKVGSYHEFSWRGREMLAQDYYTMPMFCSRGRDYCAKIITPYDEDSLYKDDKKFP